MNRWLATPAYRILLSNVPHAHALLDALNVTGRLRVVDVTIHRAATGLLHCDIDVTGLDPIDAEQWAAAHSDEALLTTRSAIRDGRVGTLWFGRIHFQAPPQVYVRLELPLYKKPKHPDERSFITLASGSEAAALEQWGDEERTRLAQTAVERTVWPLIQQAEHLGFSAVALGLRAAMERLGSLPAEELLAATAPVMMSGWIAALVRSIALSAPELARITAVVAKDGRRSEPQDPRPVFRLINLISKSGENVALDPHLDTAYWAEETQAPIFVKVHAVTGTHFDSPIALVGFLRTLSTTLLLQHRADGSTYIDVAQPSAAASTLDAQNLQSPDL
ncbi:hypothetical protein [Steroidobacter sp.]|uniref:hypothetical protein n=1 Tax=Steroidobacter sp. TaxID=1978227 RepID=UPI001A42BF71|nr:hypothetical protein [Steroidobacter sp.]MBL8270952.1 hypothetical protein [Steroidobacter sp.]